MATELTDTQKAEADALFAQLEKESEQVAYDYMVARVPMDYQEYFAESHSPPAPPVQQAA